MWIIALALNLAVAAEPVDESGLAWNWAEGDVHRWYLQTEVQLPSPMWFVADSNRQARVASFQVEFVMTCNLDGVTKRTIPFRCSIDDVAIRAASLPGDQGLLPEILAEMDQKLSAAELQVVIRRDGRMLHVDLENVVQRNRRISQMHENMRLVLARALAGFDLRLPNESDRKIGVWAQYNAELMKLPSSIGTIGAAEVAHGTKPATGSLVPIQSSGRGSMSSSSAGATSPDIYMIDMEAWAVFDSELGVLRERRWTVLGMPTASSAMSEAGEGIPYGQRGLLSYILPEEEAPAVGKTIEVAPPGSTQTAIHPWVPLGRPAGEQ